MGHCLLKLVHIWHTNKNGIFFFYRVHIAYYILLQTLVTKALQSKGIIDLITNLRVGRTGTLTSSITTTETRPPIIV